MSSLQFANGSVSVGDIFASSWGYEQTNVSFYQVVSIHGKSTVCVRPVDSEVTYINMQGYVIPKPNIFVGEEIIKRRIKDYASRPLIVIEEYERAYKTDPTEKHEFSSYS
ncbi:TPA: hypothetical protein NDW55_004925 [Klebsiella pneumoniae]|nr:hypothetical protein [Klebsiella pneumoniae]